MEEAKPRRAGELGGAAAGGWVEAATAGVTPRTGQRRKHPTFCFGQPKDSAACSLFGPTRTHASTGSRAVRCLSTAFDPHQGIDLEQSCRCANALQLGTGDRAGLAPVPWFVGKIMMSVSRAMRQVKLYPANRHLAMISKPLGRIAETMQDIRQRVRDLVEQDQP